MAVAVIEALRAQDDGTAVPLILKKLADSPLDFPTRQYLGAMDTVAFLARDPKHPQRDEVLAFLRGKLSDPRVSVRSGAAKSLGTLRDPRALALLEPLAKVWQPYADPTSEAADAAVQAIQASLEGSKELKNVWDKVQQFWKRRREELEHSLEKVKKRAEPARLP